MTRLIWLMLPVLMTLSVLLLCPGGAASSDLEHNAVVAPIFDHGRGRATSSSWSHTPVAIIPEDEGRLLIREELRHAGIIDLRENKKLPELQSIIAGFTADLYSDSRKIAVEFVSSQDKEIFGLGRDHMCRDCGVTYRFKSVAKRLNEEAAMHCKDIIFVSFYDPGLHTFDYVDAVGFDAPEKDKQRALNTVRQISKRLLRSQVQDFVQWLRDNRYLSEVLQ